MALCAATALAKQISPLEGNVAQDDLAHVQGVDITHGATTAANAVRAHLGGSV